MKKTILTLTAVTLSLTATAAARAGDKPSNHDHGTVFVNKTTTYIAPKVTYNTPTFGFTNYHLTHGVAFQYGYFYKGFDHNHWSNVFFHNGFGCKIYTCPFTHCDYYWCRPDNCFYPVHYRPYGRIVF